MSADGGGGNDVRPDNVETRHRKHSPLPKYDGAGRGYSERYAPKVCNEQSRLLLVDKVVDGPSARGEWKTYPAFLVLHDQDKPNSPAFVAPALLI